MKHQAEAYPYITCLLQSLGSSPEGKTNQEENHTKSIGGAGLRQGRAYQTDKAVRWQPLPASHIWDKLRGASAHLT